MFGSANCGFGNRVKSRAHDIAVTAYYLDFPNQRLNFHNLRKTIKSADISEYEQSEFFQLLDDAKVDWNTRSENTIKKIHAGFQTEIELEDNNQIDEESDFDPELTAGSPGSLESDLIKYKQVTVEDYKRTAKFNGKFNPVKFWEANQKNFPPLSRVALTV